MESSLKISPVEQVELLKRLYQNDLPFKAEHMEMLKETLSLSEKDGAALYGKTGTGTVNGKVIHGWLVGFVERDGKTYFFATSVEGEDEAGGSVATRITLSILAVKGIF